MSNPSNNPIRGTVFAVQRYCTHDGPGIRTTVFLKGCPLHCAWCHNPESQSFGIEISYMVSSCLSCGACVSACPNGAQLFVEKKHYFDRLRCQKCGNCVSVCPSALDLFGKLMTVDEALKEVREDKPFYGTTGGLTLSGGEPFAQPAFALALLRQVKEEGIGTCVETCGSCNYEHLRASLPYVDTFLYDYKETNPEKHRGFTGVDNALILENLEKLDAAGAKIVLRCPIIPGYNDTMEHFSGIASRANRLKNIVRVDIEPGHTIGETKKEMLGLSGVMCRFEAPSQDTVATWMDMIQKLTSVTVKKA